MARPVFELVKGSNEPIVVQLYPVATDTGANGINLTGATSMSANAKHVDTGAVVAFDSCAVYGDATEGNVRMLYDATDFSVVGLYDVQITYTDGAGYVRKYPSEGSGLRIKINGSNS